jgi:hypothetical protein
VSTARRVGAQLIDRHAKWDRGGSSRLDVRTLNVELAWRLAVEWLYGLVEDFAKLGRFPVGLQEKVMRAPQREEPLFNGRSSVLHGLCRTKRLGGDRHDSRKDVLDAMMEFTDQQALQLFNGPPFGGVHAGLLQKAAVNEPEAVSKAHYNGKAEFVAWLHIVGMIERSMNVVNPCACFDGFKAARNATRIKGRPAMTYSAYETVTSTGVRRLFHYKRFVPDHLNVLLNSDMIYFSSPPEFNDPWDCKPWFKMPDDAAGQAQLIRWLDAASRKSGVTIDEKAREQQIKRLMDNPALLEDLVSQVSQQTWTAMGNCYRVYCLTLKPACPLMWAHYGDRHRGICLELDMWQADLSSAIKVQYRDTYPTYRLDDSADLAPFYVKSSDWGYEQEYRLIAQERSRAIAPGTLMTDNGMYRMPPGTLKSIILGAQTPDSSEKEIAEMIRSSGKAVILRRARCLLNRFQLEIIPPVV